MMPDAYTLHMYPVFYPLSDNRTARRRLAWHVEQIPPHTPVKRRFEPLEVEVTRGWPVVIHRGDRAHRVRNLLDAWVVQGKWWADEERRVCFRVATDGGIMEIYRSGDEWRLARLED